MRSVAREPVSGARQRFKTDSLYNQPYLTSSGPIRTKYGYGPLIVHGHEKDRYAIVALPQSRGDLRSAYDLYSESIAHMQNTRAIAVPAHLEEDLMGAQDLYSEFIVRASMALYSPYMATLESKVEQLRDEIRSLRALQPKIVYVEEVPLSDAKEKVVQYFEKHSEADLEELMINLKIPIRILVDVIDELRKEGTLSPVGEE